SAFLPPFPTRRSSDLRILLSPSQRRSYRSAARSYTSELSTDARGPAARPRNADANTTTPPSAEIAGSCAGRSTLPSPTLTASVRSEEHTSELQSRFDL